MRPLMPTFKACGDLSVGKLLLAWLEYCVLSRTLDAALVSPGEATPFPVVDRKPDMSKGMTFNLGNNIWGTNYPMWQPYMPNSSNQRFRFEIQALDVGSDYTADISTSLAAA